MFLIDTNILISEILIEYEKDEQTLTYRAFYQQMPLIKRVLPDFILSELEIYMTQVVPSRYQKRMNENERKRIRPVTSAYMEQLIEKSTLISPSLSVIKTAFALYKRFENTHYISFTDSLLLAVADANVYTLLTKDQRLISKAKELHIDCYEPEK